MFNEGQKCIVELVADDGSQVWFKARVDRIERGLAVIEGVERGGQRDGAVTVWFPNMDGAWDVETSNLSDRYRIWSKDNEQARAGLKASKLFARLCEALGTFESAAHREGATIDPLAAKHADELKARIRKIEVMAEALETELDDVLSWLTYPAKTNDSKMTRRQVAQYLVGKRVQFCRAGWPDTVENIARLSGLTPKHVRGFERWATGATEWPGCPCMVRDDFMRRYAEQINGVEILDRIAG
jgi:hypothetical protein